MVKSLILGRLISLFRDLDFFESQLSMVIFWNFMGNGFDGLVGWLSLA
jgi:hypothetical protein